MTPDHAREAAIETDIIGGFPIAQPNCLGCGKELLIENAWMTDGCPCNHVLGVNSMNETRWRLLMQLQQRQQYQQSDAIAAATAELRAELEQVTKERDDYKEAVKSQFAGVSLVQQVTELRQRLEAAERATAEAQARAERAEAALRFMAAEQANANGWLRDIASLPDADIARQVRLAVESMKAEEAAAGGERE